MKKILFLFVLAFSITCFAQSESSLLWEISGNELDKPSYLFGTIHIIPKKDYFFTDAMEDKFKRCELLVTEIDMASLSFADKLKLSMKIFLEDGQTLESLMGREKYHSFKGYLVDSIGIKESKIDKRYNKVKPFFVMTFILKDYLGKVKFYEQELAKYSKKEGMTTGGLETVDYQFSLIEKIPMDDQVEYFLDLSSLHEFDSLLSIYKTQDISKLYTFSLETEDYGEYDSIFMNDFLYTRNENWIPQIESIIKKQPAFIAVGALHLPGENGIIELLRRKGYTIKPVK